MAEDLNREWSEDQCAKTEHLSTRENPLQMTLDGEELRNVDHFKYLGSVIDTYMSVGRDLDHRVQAAWSSWRKFTGVLYEGHSMSNHPT